MNLEYYLFEWLLVHSVDFLIIFAGVWIALKKTRWSRGVGFSILILYGMALAGGMMDDPLTKNAQQIPAQTTIVLKNGTVSETYKNNTDVRE